MQYIKTFEINTTISGVYLISNIVSGVTNAGNPYLSIDLKDKTASINCKYWDVKQDELTRFKAGDVVTVQGDVTSYRGTNQLRISQIDHEENPAQYMSELTEVAPESSDVLYEAVRDYLFAIENVALHRITAALLKKYRESFFTYPAASKNHHEFVSGLAYHVKTMLVVAEKLCEVYPTINKDLLYAGIILHDLGKIKELSGPIATEYTMEGKLLGHITIGISEIEEVANELDIHGEERILLEHMILSHHGKLEWGSPKTPMLREAEILHLIDNVDARITMMNKTLDNTKKGEFSTRVFALENRNFYHPHMYEEEVESEPEA